MRIACIFVALAIGAAAQPIHETEATRARGLLTAPQWLDKAWGAYFAGRLHSAEMQQPLVDAFREAAALRNATGVTEEYGYVAALFDAAIESGITVPAVVLEPFEEKWRAPAIILLARDPAREEPLLRLREENLHDAQWRAVNNLLLGLKSQRFFAKTLSEVNISHGFTLTDPGEGFGSGGGVFDGDCGDGVAAMPKGFPPVGVYEFPESGQEGDVLLARGPEDAYYRRVVVPTDKPRGSGSCGLPNQRENLRIGYLATLGELTVQEAASLFHQQTSVEFRSDDDLRQRWESALSGQETAIRAFVRTARERGLGSVTGMSLKIVPQLNDRRKVTSGATPALTPREFVLD